MKSFSFSATWKLGLLIAVVLLSPCSLLNALAGRPANDDFANASELPVAGTYIDLTEATFEAGEPLTSNLGSGSVWFRWTASSAGWYRAIDVWSGEIYRGATLETLTGAQLGSLRSDYFYIGSHPLLFKAAEGETIYLRLLGSGAAPSVLPAIQGDAFEDAVPMGTVSNFSLVANASELTMEPTESGYLAGSIWLAWTAPESRTYEVVTSTSNISYGRAGSCQIYNGDGSPTLATLSAADEVPAYTYNKKILRAVAGHRYLIQAGVTPFSNVIGFGTTVTRNVIWSGSDSFTVTLQPRPLPPANDDFSQATELGNLAIVEANGSNAGATNEPNELLEYEAGDTVWLHWTAPSAGNYEFLLGSPSGLKGVVFTGTALAQLTRLQSLYLGYSSPQRAVVQALAGQSFYFRFGSVGYDSGTYTLSSRKMMSPSNDDLANALLIPSPLPTGGTGNTHDATGQASVSYYDRESSIWWKWVASHTGWVRLTATSNPPSAGILVAQNQTVIGSSSAYGGVTAVRFHVNAGQTYQMSLATSQLNEGDVSFVLEQDLTLDHNTPATAIELGSVATVSVPAEQSSLDIVFGGTNGIWYHWTAPYDGWFRLDTVGANNAVSLTLLTQPYFYYGQQLSASGRPARLLWQATAGQEYWIQAYPYNQIPGFTGSSISIPLHLAPAEAPPTIGNVRVREIGPAALDKPRYWEIVIPVDSPNGFVSGSVNSNVSGYAPARFTDANRISGDAYAGEYRIALNQAHSASVLSANGSVYVNDTVGGNTSSYFNEILVAAPWSDDTSGPLLDGISGLPSIVELGTSDVDLELTLAISDPGGSGFAEGEILWDNSAVPTGTGAIGTLTLLPIPGRNKSLITFNSAQRIAGDARAGQYRVPLHLSRFLPGGRLLLRMMDAAGNTRFITYWNSLRPSIWPCNGNFNFPVTNNYLAINYYQEYPALPTTLVSGAADHTAPVFSSPSFAYIPDAGPYGSIMVSVRLTDAQSGIRTGTLRLSDTYATEETSVTTTASNLLSGTVYDGIWEVTIPVPARGYGGDHTVTWEAQDASGMRSHQSFGPTTLPDRTAADTHQPSLTYFYFGPQVVDLTTGPAELQFYCGATDDEPGLTANIQIFDSSGRLLASKLMNSAGASLHTKETIQLPMRSSFGPSNKAIVVLTLTDASGRVQTYGKPDSMDWPSWGSSSLTLSPASQDPAMTWLQTFAGGSPGDFTMNTDRDRDGIPDVMEWALGTDPACPSAADLTMSRSPRFSASPNLGISLGFFPMASEITAYTYQFRPQPGFIRRDTTTLANGPWTLRLMGSTDLLTWNAVDLPDADSDGNVSYSSLVEGGSRWFRLKLER
jgi:hypothetical protein